jgi:hypothetical protein
VLTVGDVICIKEQVALMGATGYTTAYEVLSAAPGQMTIQECGTYYCEGKITIRHPKHDRGPDYYRIHRNIAYSPKDWTVVSPAKPKFQRKLPAWW